MGRWKRNLKRRRGFHKPGTLVSHGAREGARDCANTISILADGHYINDRWQCHSSCSCFQADLWLNSTAEKKRCEINHIIKFLVVSTGHILLQVKDSSQVKQIQFRFSSKINPLKWKKVDLYFHVYRNTSFFIWGTTLTFHVLKLFIISKVSTWQKGFFFFLKIKNKMKAFKVLVTSSAQKAVWMDWPCLGSAEVEYCKKRNHHLHTQS